MSSSSHHNQPAPYNVYPIQVDNRELRLQPHELLTICWTDGFDTVCSICHKNFDNSKTPFVRTFRLGVDSYDISSPTRNFPPLAITNSHLDCLRRNQVKYFPISHAWHEPVAEAYASKLSNPAAAKMVFEIPLRILLAVSQRFGSDVEIWHDYLSIPQWQERFRGTKILPQIFDIFRNGECPIIHLDEQPAIQLLEEYTPEKIVVESSTLERFFLSGWFTRVWTAIEYDACKDGYLLNGNFEFMPASLSSLMQQLDKCHTDFLINNLTNPLLSAPSCLKWTEAVPLFVKEKRKGKCLGYVYDMIGNLGCRSFHDRFIAICALLQDKDYSNVLLELPKDAQKACLWVSKRCLGGNDWSPLLLRGSGEPNHEKAGWLKGHSIMSAKMWGLGVQTRAASTVPRLHSDKVSIEVDLVGTVTRCVSWSKGNMDNHFGFSEILPYLVKLADGSASKFIDYFERIYPSKSFWIREGSTYIFPAIRYRVPLIEEIGEKLQNLLVFYNEANRSGGFVEHEKACKEIVSMLRLLDPPTSGSSPYATLGRLQLYASICDATEYVLLPVQCQTCGTIAPVRATLWEKIKAKACLYRIPDLAYWNSLPSGMGIVVEDGRIVGRVRFGALTYCCTSSVIVQLS